MLWKIKIIKYKSLIRETNALAGKIKFLVGVFFIANFVEFIELNQKVQYNINSYLQGEIYILGVEFDDWISIKII